MLTFPRPLQDWPEIARDFYSQGLTRMQEAGLTPKATTPALQAAAVEDSPLAAAPARRRATVDVAAGFGADESSFRGLVVRPYGPTGGSERSLVEGGDLHTRHRGRRDGRSATV